MDRKHHDKDSMNNVHFNNEMVEPFEKQVHENILIETVNHKNNILFNYRDKMKKKVEIVFSQWQINALKRYENRTHASIKWKKHLVYLNEKSNYLLAKGEMDMKLQKENDIKIKNEQEKLLRMNQVKENKNKMDKFLTNLDTRDLQNKKDHKRLELLCKVKMDQNEDNYVIKHNLIQSHLNNQFKRATIQSRSNESIDEHLLFMEKNVIEKDAVIFPTIRNKYDTMEQNEISKYIHLYLKSSENLGNAQQNDQTDIQSGYIVGDEHDILSNDNKVKKDTSLFNLNLKKCRQVEILKAHNIGEVGLKELGMHLTTGACPQIKTIDLAYNNVNFNGMKYLTECLNNENIARNLYTLNLQGNFIDVVGLKRLLDILEGKKALLTLENINLKGNYLRNEGACLISHYFYKKAFTSIVVFILCQNEIKNKGVHALWNSFTCDKYIEYVPKLQQIDISRNKANPSYLKTLGHCPSHIIL